MEIPKKIYLQIQEITDGDIYPLHESLDGCTWHAERVFPSDIEYELAGENERLRGGVKEAIIHIIDNDIKTAVEILQRIYSK